MTERPYTLTAQGWPRPVVAGYPVPWVAPAEHLSQVNEGRRLASVGGAICQVCGESYAYGDSAFAFTWLQHEGEADPWTNGDYLSELRNIPSSERVYLVDGAILHHRCARLTAARCPHIRDATDLICIRVPANDADPTPALDGKMTPTYPAGDAEYAPWPS